MGAHEAEGNGEHLDDVVHGDGGGLAGVGGDPKEDGVDAADGKLEGGDGHGETGGTTGGLESELVGDVVVVVADVPEDEVEQEGGVNALEGVKGTAAGLEGVGAAGGSGSLEGGLLCVAVRCMSDKPTERLFHVSMGWKFDEGGMPRKKGIKGKMKVR